MMTDKNSYVDNDEDKVNKTDAFLPCEITAVN